MRYFYLQKETGERIGLNNETGIFLSEPSGLGLEFADNYADIGEGFFRMISKVYSQKSVKCKLNFVKDPYKTYFDFVTWCMNAKQLYLVYKPLNVEYYIKTEIASYEKGEINKFNYLEVPTSFIYLSPWYAPSALSLSFIGVDDNAFRINVSKLNGPAIIAGSTEEKYTAQIDPSGHLPGAFYLEYHGVAENPEITLVGINTGTVYGDCKINHQFASNTGFKLSTTYENSYINKILANGSEQDLLNSIDLAYEPFFKMPLNEPCILKLDDDGSLHGKLNAKIYYYYRSV